MCVLKWLYATTCLRFQLFGGCIKGPSLSIVGVTANRKSLLLLVLRLLEGAYCCWCCGCWKELIVVGVIVGGSLLLLVLRLLERAYYRWSCGCWKELTNVGVVVVGGSLLLLVLQLLERACCCWCYNYYREFADVGATTVGGAIVGVAAVRRSLLKGACVVTPLPTNIARIRGEPMAEKLGRVRPNRFQNAFSFFLALFFSFSRVEEAIENFAEFFKKQNNLLAFVAKRRRELQRHNVIASQTGAMICSATTS